MTKCVTGLIAVLCLAGCVEVPGKGKSTFSYEGETYRVVEREVVTESGTVTKRYIFSRPHPVTCSLTDDRDCVEAILISRTRAANR